MKLKNMELRDIQLLIGETADILLLDKDSCIPVSQLKMAANNLRELFPTLTDREYMLAFKLALQGKTNADLNLYGKQISMTFISNVIIAYQSYFYPLIAPILKRRKEKLKKKKEAKRSKEFQNRQDTQEDFDVRKKAALSMADLIMAGKPFPYYEQSMCRIVTSMLLETKICAPLSEAEIKAIDKSIPPDLPKLRNGAPQKIGSFMRSHDDRVREEILRTIMKRTEGLVPKIVKLRFKTDGH